MPANLPPQYHDVEKKYRLARTSPEKIAILEEMLATIPKHKGTEKLQADLKHRLAKLRESSQKKGGGSSRGDKFHVPKEGAGQVALVGPPNVGKSQLLARLTNATPDIADYPFTTRKVLPGMMEFENLKIQLVDLPPIAENVTEMWVFGVLRNADLLLLMIDLSSPDLLEQIEGVREILAEHKIRIKIGEAEEELEEELEEEFEEGEITKITVVAGNKLDKAEAQENIELLQELYGEQFPFLAISALQGRHLEELKLLIYERLDIIRVYTKAPGKKADFDDPVVLKRGSTIEEVAESIHKDLARNLKFAKIWGAEKFDGQKVQRDYVVQDGDIIEIHI
ncbi:MAG: 50S ribosome-binding GTPase [Candidatus Tectomicrobia bacterium]|nr:50S ribosome-binding GTPase [Candidatus Tectomicrobia bacterium]